jgi:hypothetical protein
MKAVEIMEAGREALRRWAEGRGWQDRGVSSSCALFRAEQASAFRASHCHLLFPRFRNPPAASTRWCG